MNTNKINIAIVPQILADETTYLACSPSRQKDEEFIYDYIIKLIRRLNIIEDTINDVDVLVKAPNLIINLLDSDSSKSDNQDYDLTFYESARDIIYSRMYGFVDAFNDTARFGKIVSLFIDTVIPIRIRGNRASFVENAILTNLDDDYKQCAKTAAQDLVNRLDIPREEVSEDMFVIILDIIPGKKYSRIVENFSY